LKALKNREFRGALTRVFCLARQFRASIKAQYKDEANTENVRASLIIRDSQQFIKVFSLHCKRYIGMISM
jgi:hypothetical protein